MDEAWLHRAPLPASVRPLLALVLDRSEAAGVSVPVAEDYDPLRDYAAIRADAPSCDPGKVYFRRGPGPAPDCARQRGIDLVPRDAAERPALRVGPRGARRLPASTSPRAPRSGAPVRAAATGTPCVTTATGAVECRADRGRHGSATGDWYAGDGSGVPWTRDGAQEIAWDRSPLADPYMFFSGNYLNYLHASPAVSDRSFAEVMARRLAQALAATSELDVALVRIDDDGPDGGFVARAPVPSETAAADVLAWAATPPAGHAPLAETLTEAARWLAGGPRRFRLRCPHGSRRPGSADRGDLPVAVRARLPSGLDGVPESGRRERRRPGRCGRRCASPLSRRDRRMRAGLPRHGQRLARERPTCATTCRACNPPPWPGSRRPTRAATRRSRSTRLRQPARDAHVRDAAVVADPQLSAAALMPFDTRAGATGVVFGLTAPRPSERWVGNVLAYALKAPAGPFEPPLVVDRDGEPAIDANGLPGAGTQSLWSDAPDANLLDGRRCRPHAARRGAQPVHRHRGQPAGRSRESARAGQCAHRARIARLGAARSGIRGRVARILPGPAHAGRSRPACACHRRVSAGRAAHRVRGDAGWRAARLRRRQRRRALGLDAEGTAGAHARARTRCADDGAQPRHRRPARRAPSRSGRRWPHRSRSRRAPVAALRPRPRRCALLRARRRPAARSSAALVRGTCPTRTPWLSRNRSSRVSTSRIRARTRTTGSSCSPAATTGASMRAARPARAAAARCWRSTRRRAGRCGRPAAAKTTFTIAGLSSVAAAPRLLDLDGDGRIDRAYVLDVVGNLWRIDFENGRDAGTLASAHRLARLDAAGRRFHFHAGHVGRATSACSSRLAIAMGVRLADAPARCDSRGRALRRLRRNRGIARP